jgi:two-component system OmpR family response regulator
MGASTIVVAREDLSIPGVGNAGNGAANDTADIEARFFTVIRDHNPDVIVLDLTPCNGGGRTAILKIRQRTEVPVLVVCAADDPRMRDYCLAGAAECLEAPVDLMRLNQAVHQIMELSKGSRSARPPEASQPVSFEGLTFYPHQNLLIGQDTSTIKLTTSENRVLIHFVSNPLALCTREALSDVLYGPYRPNSDRAVDVIVTRLRKKIAALAGPQAQGLIKTEFRRGYVFVAEVSADVPAAPQRVETPLRVRTA